MLKKEYRIRKQRDFDRIFGKEGAFFAQGFLSLKVVANGLEQSRFGFIVSNKISKSAVRRNRIKRLMREAVRLRWDNIKPGLDVVMMARTDISAKNFEDVDKAVENLLKRSGICV